MGRVKLAGAVEGCLKRTKAENCAILCYYAAIRRNSLPKFRDNLYVPKRLKGITTIRCVIAQKSAVLIYLVAESWNQAWTKGIAFCFKSVNWNIDTLNNLSFIMFVGEVA
jgi:hypothetical protein